MTELLTFIPLTCSSMPLVIANTVGLRNACVVDVRQEKDLNGVAVVIGRKVMRSVRAEPKRRLDDILIKNWSTARLHAYGYD